MFKDVRSNKHTHFHCSSNCVLLLSSYSLFLCLLIYYVYRYNSVYLNILKRTPLLGKTVALTEQQLKACYNWILFHLNNSSAIHGKTIDFFGFTLHDAGNRENTIEQIPSEGKLIKRVVHIVHNSFNIA